MKVEKPIALGAATIFLGAFLGYMPQLFQLIDKARAAQPISISDMVFLGLAMLALGIAVPSGIIAWRGKSRGETLLEEIRKRPMVSSTHDGAAAGGSAR
ncbi:MAG: hypothetical protein ACK5XA_09850 [Tagaea sp.]